MKALTLEGNTIEFKLNSPLEETDFIKEDFNFQKKSAYATIGITELIQAQNNMITSNDSRQSISRISQNCQNSRSRLSTSCGN